MGGGDLDAGAIGALLAARGGLLEDLAQAADDLRREQVGDDVTYVVNRNINFTNVCVMACRFCAFSRDLKNDAGYLLPTDEIVRRAVQAAELGATEVCVQAGLIPDGGGRRYAEILRAIRAAAPGLHLHAYSPEEIRYGAKLRGLSIRDFLSELKDAGLGSLPGTSAEVLDDAVRDRISPGRITTEQWCEVLRTAHGLGLPTTSTLMFGHVEDRQERARHLLLLRDLQRETGGLTEFVPLAFIHSEAPLFIEQVGGRVLPGPTPDDVTALYATARLVLGRDIPNLQASWVKHGLPLAARLLSAGANDLGGTLINESISTAAGAAHGQLMRPAQLRAAIQGMGRPAVERTTLYGRPPARSGPHPLDEVAEADAASLFGSYDALTADPRFRYERAPG